MSISIMKQALEALETEQAIRQGYSYLGGVRVVSTADAAINALRTAIQQAEAQQRATGEPVYQIRKAFSQDAEWAWRDATEALFHMHPKEHRRILYTHPAPAVPDALKDHQIAAMVNTLRDIARQFHGHDSLRERIANVLVPALKAEAQQPATAIACGVPGMAKTTCPYCEQGFAFEYEQPATGEPVWFHKHWCDGDDIFYRPDDNIPPGSVPLYTHPAPGVPEGFALVPLKATPKVAMVLYEGARSCFSPKVAEDLWQDALNAAHVQKGGE